MGPFHSRRRELGFHLWIKNNSDKNVIAYTISTGNAGFSTVAGVSYGFTGPAIAAGATSDEKHLYGPYVEKDGIMIPVMVFEDGGFEGDPECVNRNETPAHRI